MSKEGYVVKWKGQESGPYTLEQLQAKVDSREIKGIYEVLHRGEWKTVRAFLKEVAKPTAPAATIPESSEPGLVVPFSPGPPPPPPPPPPPSPFGIDAGARGWRARSWSEEGGWESAARAQGYEGAEVRPGERTILFYAGFWPRALASLFDHALVTYLPLWILGWILSGVEGDGFLVALRGSGAIGVVVVMLGAVLSWIYFAAFESSAWGGTPGKKMVGLVVKSEDGGRITFQTATARYFAKFLSAIMICAGFFLAAFTRKKQAFHDLLTHCTVDFEVRESRILEGDERTKPEYEHG